MGARWNAIGFQFTCLLLILVLEIQTSLSLNNDGLALLDIHGRVAADLFGSFANWNPNDNDPCKWFGVHCVAGKVSALNFSGLCLGGTLAPEIGNFKQLKTHVLYKNKFSGIVPKEIGDLKRLEALDLRHNRFSGKIPAEIGRFMLLKHLRNCYTMIYGRGLEELRDLNFLLELKVDKHLFSSEPAVADYLRKKSSPLSETDKTSECYRLTTCPKKHSLLRKRILMNAAVQKLPQNPNNLHAAPINGAKYEIISTPVSLNTGSFPAVTIEKGDSAAPSLDSKARAADTRNSNASGSSVNGTSQRTWIYYLLVPVVAVSVLAMISMLFMCRKQAVTAITPWKTGLSGQLQKAFVTGVPKLNRSELEIACEDFSNIIETLDGCTIYKGTLSSGVEIAVLSTSIQSLKEWSKSAESTYRKKIEVLSRINHKNFVNLIGYCEEDEPFIRMMVFEYAPNGTLYEHLHVKEMEHLDWSARTRIIMGIAYCLQHMHHDLNPPVPQSSLSSRSIYLTDDYAAKIAQICFTPEASSRPSLSNEKQMIQPNPNASLESNVYDFGILMLEIISRKLPYSNEKDALEKWAMQYLNEKRNISCMIDPALKSFKNNELEVLCEVIRECLNPDPSQRPTMKDVVANLKDVLAVSPSQAIPRLSPLWWAELEILSLEAT